MDTSGIAYYPQWALCYGRPVKVSIHPLEHRHLNCITLVHGKAELI